MFSRSEFCVKGSSSLTKRFSMQLSQKTLEQHDNPKTKFTVFSLLTNLLYMLHLKTRGKV